MRLKITLKCEKLKLPMNYQNIIQGVIYNLFEREKYGNFLHDEGYRAGNKKFKMFIFSNIFGKYEIKENNLIFYDKIHFYISSYSEKFLQIIFETLLQNDFLCLNFQKVKIFSIEIKELPYFEGIQKKRIRTISPVVAYRTVDKYVHYYKPTDSEFFELCKNNLVEKYEALNIPCLSVNFEIIDVINQKKRLLKFKNTFYESYLCELDILVDYETLSLIFNTGLSAKGSSGFGMIEIV